MNINYRSFIKKVLQNCRWFRMICYLYRILKEELPTYFDEFILSMTNTTHDFWDSFYICCLSHFFVHASMHHFVRPACNKLLKVVNPKAIILLTKLHFGLNELRWYSLIKHSYLDISMDTLNPMCCYRKEIETERHLFVLCPKFTYEEPSLHCKFQIV